MQHLSKLTVGRFEARPFHIECSCGPAGDFDSEEAARSWMQHRHFDGLTGLFETEIISFLPDPNAVPEEAPLPDFVDSATPTDSAPAPASPPESGAEVHSETVGDA